MSLGSQTHFYTGFFFFMIAHRVGRVRAGGSPSRNERAEGVPGRVYSALFCSPPPSFFKRANRPASLLFLRQRPGVCVPLVHPLVLV